MSGFLDAKSDVGSSNVQGITAQAGNFTYSDNVPLRYWIRTADAVQKQAQFYERDGDDQQAYFFMFRHALLAWEKLPNHPECKTLAGKKALGQVQQVAEANMKNMAELRPKINLRHQRYQEALAKRRAERERWAKENAHGGDEVGLASGMDNLSLWPNRDSSPSLLGEKRILVGGEHRDLATRIANNELRKTTRIQSPNDDGDEGPNSLANMMVAVRRQRERSVTERNDATFPEREASFSAPRYPSVPQKTAYQRPVDTPMRPMPRSSIEELLSKKTGESGTLTPQILPQRPPKERPFSPPLLPPRPDKISELDAYEYVSRSSTSTPDLSPRNYNFKASAKSENGQPLRTIFISPNLRGRFLNIAAPNTRRNLETLGILCGRLISNAFFISSLVIPDQTSTSDTCDMEDEAALVDYCEDKDVMTLGWIHTHPTQTCFMSSRDLHTHGGYQMQMAESIAIVCAPSREPSWGVFRLTNPPGLPVIMSCNQTGIFHPHAESNIYTDAMKPGHVVELAGLDFEVIDLRRNKT